MAQVLLMTFVNLEEAQLYNLLSGFFGREHVIPHMSVQAVCGGSACINADKFANKNTPNQFSSNTLKPLDIKAWAQDTKCLFTIIDGQDLPKMVIEFFSGFSSVIDVQEEEKQRILPTLLAAAGVRYVTISPGELSELLNPNSLMDLQAFLQDKVLDE